VSVNELTLIRRHSKSHGTYGELEIGERIYHSAERPWLSNRPRVSCVPRGTYRLRAYTSAKYPDVYILSNPIWDVYEYEVPPGKQGRSHILIHPANFPSQLAGCIAFGMSLEEREGQEWAVWDSRKAVSDIFAHIRGEKVQFLNIREAFGG
jgi:hypothetical protein